MAYMTKNTKSIVDSSEKEVIECQRVIDETTAKMQAAAQRSIENGDKAVGLLKKMGEIAYIEDETLWT